MKSPIDKKNSLKLLKKFYTILLILNRLWIFTMITKNSLSSQPKSLKYLPIKHKIMLSTSLFWINHNSILHQEVNNTTPVALLLKESLIKLLTVSKSDHVSFIFSINLFQARLLTTLEKKLEVKSMKNVVVLWEIITLEHILFLLLVVKFLVPMFGKTVLKSPSMKLIWILLILQVLPIRKKLKSKLKQTGLSWADKILTKDLETKLKPNKNTVSDSIKEVSFQEAL